ncbi:hypothetical protein Ddye_009972 [Dipteronia dyeriana]|uniref:CCHC-type domain-containing protein n=1 Tax=Dipteronia dyeriana TaxID=168575 RepID=A0AAE0CMQ2_9ROSI|nr:hypothetical protein Ddye_009972 [Dipteronia dyeriana]
MSASSSRYGIEPDDMNSSTGQSVANYETNWDEKDLINWQLPNIQQSSIYKKKLLDFRTFLGQKNKEINVKLQNSTFTTNLLNKNSLTHYNKIGFNDLHIGSVQVGIKSISKIGLNNSLLIVLRDKRNTNYKESILGMAETSLTYGSIYFQCYPNFIIALNTDEHKEKCLVINIQTHNFQFLEKSSPYKLVYRVHYRVLTSGLIPNYIPPAVPAVQTICFNASPSVNVLVPVPVKWKNINFPDDWVKEKVDQPSYKPPMINLYDCVSEQDGTLRISFRRGLSIQDNDSDHSRSLKDFQEQLEKIDINLSQSSVFSIPKEIPPQVFVPYESSSSDKKAKGKVHEPNTEVLMFPDHTGIEKCFDHLIDERELLKALEERLQNLSIPQSGVQTLDKNISTSSRFEGQLFSWWTHTLSLNARTSILNHTKELTTTTPVRSATDPTSFIPTTSTTTTTSQPDGIDVLCYTILMHFVGNPNINQGKEFSKIQNLKCKRLSDFKWYKDIFLTRVLQRPDNANAYWKEKFISGLPKLFSNKVRDKMIEHMGWSDWSQMDLNTWTDEHITIGHQSIIKKGKYSKNKRTTKTFKKSNKCFKRGKDGHYANKCRDQKNKIKSLDIGEEIKDKVLQILHVESDSELEASTSPDEVLVIGDSSGDTSYDSSSDSDPDIQLCICKEINVVDQYDFSLIISMIDNIEDLIQKAKHI